MKTHPLLILLQLVVALLLFNIGVGVPVRAATTVRFDEADGLSSHLVGGGVQDSCGLLWFATWNGLNCYDGYDFHRVRIRPGDCASIGTNLIRDIILTGDGNIVCHTDNDVYLFDLSTYTFRDVLPSRRDSLMKIVGRRWHGLTDRQGILWTADRSGLYKHSSLSVPARVIPSTAHSGVRALMADGDSLLWIGSRTDFTLRAFSHDTMLVREIHLPMAPYSIYRTTLGGLWVGGKPGALVRIIDGTVGPSLTDVPVYDMAQDSAGRLWIATFGDGIRCCPNPEAGQPEISQSLGGGKVRKLIITPSCHIIAASTDGLLIGCIDGNDWRKTEFRTLRRDGNNAGSLASNSLLSVARDRNDNIFIATESSGVDMINERELFGPSPVFTHLDIPSAEINQALAVMADSVLMIVGGNHVTLFEPSTGSIVNLASSFFGDSCHFSETSPVLAPDGNWVLAADEGAFMVHPDSMFHIGYTPPLVFTTLAVNGGVAEFGLIPHDNLSLPPDHRNITIGFAALDYADNSGIFYRTRLDGSTWSGTGKERTVTLFNLTPGTHRLEVQSTDCYGRWAGNTRSLAIEVAPYWYETWWARALSWLLATAVVVGVIYTGLYIRRINRQRRELLEKYMEVMTAPGRQAEMLEADAGPSVQPSPLDSSPSFKPEDIAFLQRLRSYIEANIDNSNANVDEMASAAAVSRSTLNRRLRSLLGVSAAQLLTETRLHRARQLLAGDPTLSMADVAMMCGYTDAHYFQRVYRKRFDAG